MIPPLTGFIATVRVVVVAGFGAETVILNTGVGDGGGVIVVGLIVNTGVGLGCGANVVVG